MDNFLNDIQYSIFIQYVFLHLPHSSLNSDDFGTSILYQEKGISILFLKSKIIEYKIEKEGKICYYLHCTFKNFYNATQLFHDFLEFLNRSLSLKVLVCCSSALTSSYLVEGLKEHVQTHYENIDFDACSYNCVAEKGATYDIVLLAPQISYLANQLPKNLNVKVIPTNLYATYNYDKIIDILKHIAVNEKK